MSKSVKASEKRAEKTGRKSGRKLSLLQLQPGTFLSQILRPLSQNSLHGSCYRERSLLSRGPVPVRRDYLTCNIKERKEGERGSLERTGPYLISRYHNHTVMKSFSFLSLVFGVEARVFPSCHCPQKKKRGLTSDFFVKWSKEKLSVFCGFILVRWGAWRKQ